MTAPSTSGDVLVLGAGPAGLGAAYRLASRGHSVVVLERAPTVGGLAASFDVAGVRVDYGSHRLHPATPPEIMAALRSLLGDDLQRRRRRGRIRIAGRLVAFPPHPIDLLRNLPPRLTVRLAADVIGGPLRREPGATFAEALHTAVGPTLSRELYDPYVTKLFGRDPHELSPELARRRVGTRTSLDLVRKTLRRSSDADVFYAPVRGFGQIPEALADAATTSGAEIRVSSEATRIEIGDGSARAFLSDGTTVEAGRVWSTIPLPALARIGGAPHAVLDAAAGLVHRALVLVYLVLDRPRWTTYDAHYFPSLDVPFHRVSEPKSYRDCAADPRDVTVLCAEIPCDLGDATWRATTHELGDLVATSLAREGLPAAAPVHVEVRRVPNAYPVYDLGYAARFAVLDEWAASQSRLLTYGRQGLFAHDNTHHALAMAWAAADALRDDVTFDARAWAEARGGVDPPRGGGWPPPHFRED